MSNRFSDSSIKWVGVRFPSRASLKIAILVYSTEITVFVKKAP